MTSHSPTPWRVVEYATNAIDIVDANERCVCQVLADNETDELTDLDRENAEVIVRYVNSCSEDKS